MDFTKTIINAIKIWVNKQLSFIENKISDLEDRPSAFIQPEEPNEAPDGTLWIDTDEDSISGVGSNTAESLTFTGVVEATYNGLSPVTVNIPKVTVNGITANENGDIQIDIPEVNYPVTSVNGQTGDVSIDVPVTSVNGMTGVVQIEIPEIPTTLPNPNTLTFTGAVEGSYNGTEAVTIDIPEMPEIPVTSVNGMTGNVVINIPEQVQADWEQHDSIQLDYVKNKTHYKQVEDSQEILNVLYKASTLSDKYYQYDLPISCEPVLGESYDVWIYGEGTTRGCILKQYNDTMWYLGNLTIMPYNWYEGDDTGENFLITFRVSNGQLAFGSTATICTSTYISSYDDANFIVTGPGIIYYPLDKRYLPNDVKDFISKSYVQSVNGFTPSNDGSIWMAPYKTTEDIDIIKGLYASTDSGRRYVYASQNDPIYETNVIAITPVELIVGEAYVVSGVFIDSIDGSIDTFKSNPNELKVSSDGSLYVGNPVIAGLPDDIGTELNAPTVQYGVIFYHTNNVVTGVKYCTTYNLYDSGSYNLSVTGPKMKYVQLDEKFIPDTIARITDIPDANSPKNEFILNSTTEDSTKQFKITIDDSGTLTITEITEEVD